jgi:hypothetical protein
MSKKLNTKTITKGASTKAPAGAARGSFEKAVMPYQTEKVGMNGALNATSLAESHTAAFLKWRKDREG